MVYDERETRTKHCVNCEWIGNISELEGDDMYTCPECNTKTLVPGSGL